MVWLLFIVLALAAPLSAVTITQNLALGPDDRLLDGLAVTVEGCTLTLGGAHTFQSLLVAHNGCVTHTPGDSAGLRLSVAEWVIIDVSSSISADGRGDEGNRGWGAGEWNGLRGSGGGHGGEGGHGGAAYGSIAQPTTPGSGGGGPEAGAGGGRIHLSVGGRLLVSGEVSARGAPGTGASGGGAGGSIWIEADTLTGYGRIDAAGGLSAGGGGGAGGRIALACRTHTLLHSPLACGGRGTLCGGAGTVYTQHGMHSSLTLANCGCVGAETPLQAVPDGLLSVTEGAWARPEEPLVLQGDLHVGYRSRVVAAPQAMLDLTIFGHATVDSGAVISAGGRGYPARTGPAAGGTGLDAGGGGGHAGRGGAGFQTSGGGSSGSIAQPTDPGSGGGYAGGAGGGVIHLKIGGTLTVHGQIDADGAPGAERSGGGAGGSVWIQASTIAGTGTVSANGGSGGNDGGGGGGGGRIAITGTAHMFTGVLRAWAGDGFDAGGAGTVYVRMGSAALGQLSLSSPTLHPAATPLADLPPCHLSIGRGALAEAADSLRVAGNVDLKEGGELWSVSGRELYLQSGGAVTLDSLSRISAAGRGAPAQRGFGAGQTDGAYSGGGGYGGRGGASVSGTHGGPVYGSVADPMDLGSGGGGSSGGRGGGLLTLAVAETLQVDGHITADGTAGGLHSGGGSGGSLRIGAAALCGAGWLMARGGSGGTDNGGGGGGRIALYVCHLALPDTHIRVDGGHRV